MLEVLTRHLPGRTEKNYEKPQSEWRISDRDSSKSEILLNQLTYSVDLTLREFPCHHRVNCLGIVSSEVNLCTSTWWFTACCHKSNAFRPHIRFQNSTTCGAHMRVFWDVTPNAITSLFWFYLIHICAHSINKVVLIINFCSSRFFVWNVPFWRWCFSIHLKHIQSPWRKRQHVSPKRQNKYYLAWCNNQKTKTWRTSYSTE
jgi:hypothetical protein